MASAGARPCSAPAERGRPRSAAGRPASAMPTSAQLQSSSFYCGPGAARSAPSQQAGVSDRGSVMYYDDDAANVASCAAQGYGWAVHTPDGFTRALAARLN